MVEKCFHSLYAVRLPALCTNSASYPNVCCLLRLPVLIRFIRSLVNTVDL